MRRQRHRPEGLSCPLGRGHDLLAKVRCSHDGGHVIAQGHDLGSGESRHVQDGVRLLGHGPGQGVGHDQASLRVGVGDLDRRAVEHRDDVAGALGVGSRHVLGQCQPGGHSDRQSQARSRHNSAQHCGGPGHVGLHLRHGGSRLEGQASGVEGDALADECHVLEPGRVIITLSLGASMARVLTGLRGNPLQADQARRVHRSLGDAKNPAESLLDECRGVPHLDPDPGLLPGGSGPLREDLRGQAVGGLVDEVTGQGCGLGQYEGAGQCLLPLRSIGQG